MAQTFLIQNGDWVVSSASGRPITITSSVKVKQDVQEFFSIAIQPSGFGAGIDDLVGVVVNNGAEMVGLVDKHIADGISDWVNLQKADTNTPRTPDELISGETNLSVSQDPEDPTRYNFYVNIVTESGDSIPVVFTNSST